MDQAKAKEVFSDKTFVTSLLKLETAEEAQKALKARGLELSLDEVKAIGDGLTKSVEKGGDLSEDELEKVAGGGVGIAITAITVGVGVAIASIKNRWRW